MTGLILKRSPLGPDQNQEDYDVPADGVIVGRRGSHADARLRGYARGSDGGIREELAAGVDHRKADDKTQRTGSRDFVLRRDRH